MKNLILFLLLVLAALPVAAQEVSPGDVRSSDARLNFSVPDAPAFAILHYTPSVVVRPSSVREVGFAVADFVGGGGVLPKAFAAEFSPGLLVGGRTLSIRQYNANPFWYRARVSIASRSLDEDIGRMQASIGLRLTLTDEADPRADKDFIEELSRLAASINQVVARSVQTSAPTGSGPIVLESPNVDDLEAEVDRLRARQRDRAWNANIAEVAAAVRFRSTDSLARNTVADKYQAWVAGSFRVEEWGQFVFNLVGSLERTSAYVMDSTSIAMNSRFYFGSNTMKVYGEGQITALESSPALYLFSVGGEIAPVSSFWLEFAAGLEKHGKNPGVLRTAFHVRWSLPESWISG